MLNFVSRVNLCVKVRVQCHVKLDIKYFGNVLNLGTIHFRSIFSHFVVHEAFRTIIRIAL